MPLPKDILTPAEAVRAIKALAPNGDIIKSARSGDSDSLAWHYQENPYFKRLADSIAPLVNQRTDLLMLLLSSPELARLTPDGEGISFGWSGLTQK